MSKTQAVATRELAERLGDPTYTYFTEQELRTWINEGQREIARRAEWMRTTATISVVAGTQNYSLAAAIVRFHKVTFARTGSSQVYPLEYRDQSAADVAWGSMRAITQSASPDFYTTWGYPGTSTHTITLYPTPSEAGTLTVYYYAVPTDLAITGSAASTAVSCPEGWEDVILDYAETRAELRRQDLDAYRIKDAIFKDHLRALADTAIRYTDNPGQVTFALDYPDTFF